LAKLDDADVASQQAAVNSISALVVAFPEIKPDVLAKIRKLEQTASVPMKLNSLSVFVNIQGEGYHDELLLASKESDPTIRQKAISLMGKFGEERFADQLVLSLADESTGVRLAAINAIVRLRPEKGLDPLISSLEDTDVWIRTAAAQALGEYRHQSAVLALDKIPDRSSFPHLLEALENRAILDDVSDVFVRHKELYRDLLEEAWRVADSRREVVIAAILSAMKQ